MVVHFMNTDVYPVSARCYTPDAVTEATAVALRFCMHTSVLTTAPACHLELLL